MGGRDAGFDARLTEGPRTRGRGGVASAGAALLPVLPLLLSFPAIVAAAAADHFTRLSVEQGLSQSTVRAIVQDHVGFVWFGTEEGLNRYDGYSFAVFKHDPRNPKSLPNDLVLSLHEDREQRLWIGTDRGLAVFDRRTETFARIPSIRVTVTGIVEDPDGTLWVATEGSGLFKRNAGTEVFVMRDSRPDDPASLASYGLSALFRDRSGRLWVGTRHHGLDLLDKGSRRFVHHRHDPHDPRSIGSDNISALTEDPSGDLWVATYGGGVSVRDHKTGFFRHYRHAASDRRSLGSDLITCALTDRSGRVWLGTDGAGVQRYLPATGGFQALLHDPGDPGSLSQNVVRTLFEDSQGQIWVGTYLGGVDLMKKPRPGFDYFTHDVHDPSSLSDPSVASFLEDREGRLWIGTEHGWLDRYDPRAGTFLGYRFPSTVAGGSAVLSLHQDRRGRIWAGTYLGGLGRFDPVRGTFAVFRHRAGDPASVGGDDIWAIAEDDQGTLWLGSDSGLDRFDPDREVVVRHYDTPNAEGLGYAGVRALLVDGNGNLWIGTLGGLNLMLRGEAGLIRYRHDEADPRTLSNDGVISLHEDAKRRLWVGTLGGGLNLLEAVKGTFTAYKNFASNVVYAIEEDGSGRLWVSTNHGLGRFDPARGRVENYDLTNGLQSLQFHIGESSLRTRGGRLLFGSVDGFYDFDPSAINPDTFAPPVVFTSFRVFNEPAPLPAQISVVDTVTLSPRDKVVSLEFAALDFAFPRRNQYAYALFGFRDQWTQLGVKRDVTFTNLDPGTYVLRVKASNSDGVWGPASAAALRIVVRPPFWKTWWFRTLCAGAIALVLIALHRLRVRYLTADLAERKRAEAALRQAEGKYRSILENAVEGIFQTTGDGRFLSANPALARMLGYGRPEALLAEVTDIEHQLYVDAARHQEIRRLVDESGVVHGFECELRRRDGSTLWVAQSVRAVRDEAGGLLYYEGSTVDISDRDRARHAEAALRAALREKTTADRS